MEHNTPQNSPTSDLRRSLARKQTPSPITSVILTMDSSPSVQQDEPVKHVTEESDDYSTPCAIKICRGSPARSQSGEGPLSKANNREAGCKELTIWKQELKTSADDNMATSLATRRGVNKHLQLPSLRQIAIVSSLKQNMKDTLSTPLIEEPPPITPVDQIISAPLVPPPAPRQPYPSRNPSSQDKARISKILVSEDYPTAGDFNLDRGHALLKGPGLKPLLSPIKLVENYTYEDDIPTPFANTSFFNPTNKDSPTTKTPVNSELGIVGP